MGRMEVVVAFAFTDEQTQLRQVVRAFLQDNVAEAEVRRIMTSDDGFDRTLWRRLAEDIGLQGLLIPDELGGSGAGFVEVAIALEEMGRRLFPGPYLSTVLATIALLECGDEPARSRYLPRIATGELVATLAVAEAAGTWGTSDLACRATADEGGTRLTGEKRYVTDGQAADLAVVVATGAAGMGLFLVELDQPGITVTAESAFDRTRRLASITFAGAVARPLENTDGLVIDRVLTLAGVALSAEQAGVAQEALDMAVAYAKDRVQFGRAIGSFQAVKHLLADALLEVESARSAAYFAAWAAADKDDALDTVAPLAQAYCSDACYQAAATCMQVHGGISFTWEHPAHLYYRRAKSSVQLLGAPRVHRERVAQQLGL